ncbi:hypothetical protein ACS0TY_007383 [Phlomoides rotata]
MSNKKPNLSNVIRNNIAQFLLENCFREDHRSCNTLPSQPSNKKMQVDITLIQAISLRQRSTLRRLAKGLGVSKSTVGRWVKKGEIIAHTNAINPDLTAVNKGRDKY